MAVKEHDIYRDRAPLWWFWTLTYAGGEYMRGNALYSLAGQAVRRMYPTKDIADSDVNYLWRFPGEEQAAYNSRIERAHFDRLAGSALDAIVAGVTQDAADPTVPEAMAPLLADVDARGTKWDEWTVNKATIVGMCGHTHVGVDLPSAEMIEREMRAPGLPFLYLIPPLSMVCWELDEYGEWAMATVREAVPCGQGKSAAMRLRYRIWTPETIRLVDGNGAPIQFTNDAGESIGDTIENPYGKVPITTTYYAPDPLLGDERIGRSWMEGPARKNQEHYNLGSMILEIAFKVTFPTLAISVPEGESSIAPEQKVAMGLNQALAYTGAVPQWLNPPRESIDVLRDLRNENAMAIRHAAGLAAPEMPGQGSQEMPSGEALRQTRVNLGALLGSFGTQLSAGDTRDLKMAAHVGGFADDEIQAPYPEDYAAPDSLVRLDEVIKSLVDVGLREVPEANALLMEAALKVVLPAADNKRIGLALEQIKIAAEEAAAAEKARKEASQAAMERLANGEGAAPFGPKAGPQADAEQPDEEVPEDDGEQAA